MKLSIQQQLIAAFATLSLFQAPCASASISPMVLSRNALSMSVRGVSFGKSNSIDNGPFDYSSPSCFEGDDIYEDGSDDNVFETSNRDKNGGLNNDVLLCSVSAIQSPKYYK